MNTPAPLSQRQYDYMLRCFSSWFNVAEGGKRGGKNVLNTLVFCSMLETHKDKIHLVAGVSVATAKLNILDCDGYGLLNYFEGRCREGKYKDRDCVHVKTKTGEKIVLISGGGKDGDEKLIKGNTYGMAYVTEANECHQKFLKEVFDRTLSSSDRKIFHDLNPKDPSDWYYTEILAFHEEQQKQDSSYGYNYGHFTLVDNMSLPDDKVRNILKTYQKGTVWYNRDIKGERAVAEGIIFRYFANNSDPYTLNDSDIFDKDGKLKLSFTKLVVGIDFGGNKSMTTFTLSGYVNGYDGIIALEEDGLPITEEIASSHIEKAFIRFMKRCTDVYGRINYVFPDNAATTMVNTLRQVAIAEGYGYIVDGCVKTKILSRAFLVDNMLTCGDMKVSKRCPGLINALCKLRWDEKKEDEIEDLNKDNINDRFDSFCYSFTGFQEYFETRRK